MPPSLGSHTEDSELISLAAAAKKTTPVRVKLRDIKPEQ